MLNYIILYYNILYYITVYHFIKLFEIRSIKTSYNISFLQSLEQDVTAWVRKHSLTKHRIIVPKLCTTFLCVKSIILTPASDISS